MTRVRWTGLAVAAGLLLASAGTAAAEPPITDTEVTKPSESFSDEPFLCQDELYTISGEGHMVVHFTFFEDTGALMFHLVLHAQVVAVPLDGTGPSYRGTFGTHDIESIRSVRNAEELVEQDTDFNRVVARGSDGSRAFLYEHAHFTMNAAGEMTAEFETTRMVCT